MSEKIETLLIWVLVVVCWPVVWAAGVYLWLVRLREAWWRLDR